MSVKRYEGLFILNTAGKEEGVKEIIDKISAEIAGSGGKVETVQKMDRRHFSRVADKKYPSGFYANIIFESDPAKLAPLRNRLGTNEEIFRVLFTDAAAKKPEVV
jgi:ribosomal protein S6